MRTLFELYDLRLQYHDSLNPALWDGEKLRPEVRERVAAAARLWMQFARVPPEFADDVVITGGNVNYNWTPWSDLDVHVVADRTVLGMGVHTEDFLKSKKKLWGLTHHIEIKGIPLEMYVQDPSERVPGGQGVYSVTRDEWVQKPAKGSYDFDSDARLKKKAEHYSEMISSLLDRGAPAEDFRVMKEKLKKMRTEGLKRGEFGRDNLVFKSLRNNGLLDSMTQYVRDRENEELSLR